MNLISVTACVCLALVACGGSSHGGLIGGDSGGASADGATGNDGGGASSGDGGAGNDASRPPSDGGGVTNDGGAKDPPIDPLTVGNTWTYDVTEVGTYPACPSGSHDGKVLSSAQRDGKLAYETQSLCANAGTFYYAADGDVVYWDYAGTWVILLDAPVVDGHSWTNGTVTYAWHDVGSVTVPAGTFSKCWKAQDTGGPSYTIFCRGVGAVHWSYRDATGANGYDAVLTAKNF